MQTLPDVTIGANIASFSFLVIRVATIRSYLNFNFSASNKRQARTMKSDGHWVLYYKQIDKQEITLHITGLVAANSSKFMLKHKVALSLSLLTYSTARSVYRYKQMTVTAQF
jgi:hypothetical protein